LRFYEGELELLCWSACIRTFQYSVNV